MGIVHNRICSLSLLLASLLIVLAACTSPPEPEFDQEWKYTDLRLLDPAESQDVSIDLIAIYTRTNGSDLQIRIDLLDQQILTNFDIYLAIDNQSGGTDDLPIDLRAELKWDRLIYIPNIGDITVLNNNSSSIENLGVRVHRDLILDFIVVKFIRPTLVGTNQSPWSTPHLRMQVFLTPPAETRVLDKSETFYFDNHPPNPVPVIFAFWNTFPAYSPSMSLRKWDGAHTGPMGGRHGLSNLLQAADLYEIPLFLLDAAFPNSLSALDFFRGT